MFKFEGGLTSQSGIAWTLIRYLAQLRPIVHSGCWGGPPQSSGGPVAPRAGQVNHRCARLTPVVALSLRGGREESGVDHGPQACPAGSMFEASHGARRQGGVPTGQVVRWGAEAGRELPTQ